MQDQWVVKSLAVWGLIVTVLSGAMPGIESLVAMANPDWAFHIAPEWITSLNEGVKNVIAGMGVVIGSLMVIIDRVTGHSKKTLVLYNPKKYDRYGKRLKK